MAPISRVFFPFSSELAARGEAEGLRRTLVTGTRFLLGVALPLRCHAGPARRTDSRSLGGPRVRGRGDRGRPALRRRDHHGPEPDRVADAPGHGPGQGRGARLRLGGDRQPRAQRRPRAPDRAHRGRARDPDRGADDESDRVLPLHVPQVRDAALAIRPPPGDRASAADRGSARRRARARGERDRGVARGRRRRRGDHRRLCRRLPVHGARCPRAPRDREPAAGVAPSLRSHSGVRAALVRKVPDRQCPPRSPT